MSRFVNPFTDVGFKIIFGQPASKQLLITLLNELLRGEHHIEDLSFLDKEDHSDNINDRGIIYDLYCRTNTGEFIIVEMQNRWHHNFLDRTLLYGCRAVSRLTTLPPPDKIKVPEPDSTDTGICREPEPEAYGKRYKLCTVYGIFLMNFKEHDLEPKFRTDTGITDLVTGRVVNPHFRQIYLQFPYFDKRLDECENLYDKLIYTLKNMESWDRMPSALKEQVFKRLEQLASVANLSLENRIAYEKAVDSFYVSRIWEEDVIRRGEEIAKKGLEEGLKKGMQKGLEKGMQKGLEKGRKETQVATAVNLKKAGIPLSTIAQCTGLSLEELESL